MQWAAGVVPASLKISRDTFLSSDPTCRVVEHPCSWRGRGEGPEPQGRGDKLQEGQRGRRNGESWRNRGLREREREPESQRETERARESQRARKGQRHDRKTDRERGTETERQKGTERERQRDRKGQRHLTHRERQDKKTQMTGSET